ncbi:hypothetical protein NQ317_017711 [Molorchus minor]|uniref:Cytochrome P450 n=1 Tax=Molorchus minor TaxID=1323400 RepID=A0ABQ9JGN7_9CUCU|nr:hypothetical protein NQ317_017711 [Molorchus minor]
MDITNLTTYSLFALSVVLCVYILWFYKQTFAYWRKRGLIYLEPTIPFGNAYDVCLKKHTFGELFAQFYLKLKERGVKHGGAYIFWKPVYIPVDSEIIRNILIRDSEYFPNHGMYINEKNDPLSGHIFNMENVEWRNFRSKMPSVFTSAKMRKMFLIMEGMTKRFNSNLNAYAKSGHAVDIKKETTKFTTDIIAACAFGIESNTMKNENEEMLKQARGFFDYQWNYIRNTLVMTLPRPFLKKINFRIMPKGLERYFRDLCEKIINHRKESHLDRGDLADTLMRLMQKRETDFTGKDTMEPLNFEQFMAQACVFFSAGFETSSSTQTFAMYELAKDLDCQVKLRKEIDKVLEKYDNKVTYEAVMEMKYLDCVVDGKHSITLIFREAEVHFG